MKPNDHGQPTIADLQLQIEELRHRIAVPRDKLGARPRRLRRRMGGRTLIAALVSVVSALVVGGAAFASIPDSGGVIHGCYTTTGGLLVLSTSPTGSCHTGLSPISWSQTGPRGLQGTPGINGTNGTNGVNGTNGIDGRNGIDGTNGAKGDTGSTGPSGVSGYQIVSAETTGLNRGDSATVACPTGKHALGGGGEITGDLNGGAFVAGGEPMIGGTGWKVFTDAYFTFAEDEIRDQAGANEIFSAANAISVDVHAICVTTTS